MTPTPSGADAPISRAQLDSPRDAGILARITSHLQGALPLEEVLRQISRGVVEGLGVLRADVFLLDEARRELFAADLRCPVTDETELLSATVIRAETRILDDFGSSAPGIGVDDRLRMRLRPGALAAVPLIAWGKVMGLILLNDSQGGPSLEARRPLLEAIAQQAGLAIERARLYEDRERAIRELTNLQEATALLQSSQPLDEILQRILHGVTEALEVDRAILFLHDPARGVLRGAQAALRSSGAPDPLQTRVRSIEIPVDDPAEVMAATVLERRPCSVTAAGGSKRKVSPALEQILHMGSFVTAPLLAKDKVMGVLTVDNFQREVPFKDRLHMLMAYGAQAGMAVERTLLEERLRRSEKRYRHFIEHSPDAILESSPDGRLLGCNSRAVELFGYSREELLSMTAGQIWTDPARREELLTELGRKGHVEGFHVRVKRKDGRLAHVEVSSRLSRIGEESVIESIIRDVTQRFEIERKMRMLSDAVTYSADAFVSLDPDGRITSWNNGAEKIFGYTAAEMLDRPYQTLVPPERMDEFCGVIRKTVEREGQLQGFETVRLHKDGRRIPVSISVSMVHREEGQDPGISVVVRDITERKLEERRRHLLSSITEQSPDAILSLDPDGLITSWNRGAEKMFGYAAGEIVGRPWLVLSSSGSEADFRAVTDGRTEGTGGNGTRTIDTVAKSRQGTQLPVSLSASELHDEDKVRVGWSVILRDLTEQKTLAEMSERLQEELFSKNRLEGIIGNSRDMEEVRERIRRVARFNSSVLLVGPSGTGKEIVANAIHYNSPRREKPFIKVNCAAIPEDLLESELLGIERNVATGVDGRIGRFEMADGGTMFLDEIGDMSLATQAKILRVLQEREFERVGGKKVIKVDLRIIAATNKDLETEIKARRFREDLYYRLNVIVITLPPLAERREDIDPLIDHFLQKFALENNLQRKTLSLEARLLLNQYDWPGNVRELEHAVERAVVMGESSEITVKDLPPSILIWRDLGGGRPQDGDSPGDGLAGIMRRVERRAVLQALDRCGWVQARAARMLGISERSMWYRVKKLGLKPGSH